jgi:hypothetical protein
MLYEAVSRHVLRLQRDPSVFNLQVKQAKPSLNLCKVSVLADAQQCLVHTYIARDSVGELVQSMRLKLPWLGKRSGKRAYDKLSEDQVQCIWRRMSQQAHAQTPFNAVQAAPRTAA